MIQNNSVPSGQWNGFYLEDHHDKRNWMHLYLDFSDTVITGEGTDYVGPWHLSGSYDLKTGQADWVKQYVGKHTVSYRGKITNEGIVGDWDIRGLCSGPFHIWPQFMTELNQLYLEQDLSGVR